MVRKDRDHKEEERIWLVWYQYYITLRIALLVYFRLSLLRLQRRETVAGPTCAKSYQHYFISHTSPRILLHSFIFPAAKRPLTICASLMQDCSCAADVTDHPRIPFPCFRVSMKGITCTWFPTFSFACSNLISNLLRSFSTKLMICLSFMTFGLFSGPPRRHPRLI